METTLLVLAACLMFSGVHSESQSMSCSTINGRTICNKQTSQGNSAMASSQAHLGGDSSFQETYAGAGSPNQWDSSSQAIRGDGYASGFYYPPISYDYYGNQEFPGSFGGGPFTGVSSFVSSGSPNSFAGSQTGGGAFAGGWAGRPYGASHYDFPSAGFPNVFSVSEVRPSYAVGFAAAGNFPFFSPGVDYPDEDSSSSFGGAPVQGSSYAGPMPAHMNPFAFVNRFMGGGPAAGAYAGPGFYPFGRR